MKIYLALMALVPAASLYGAGTQFSPAAAGTIRDALPKPPLEPTRKILYPKPGEIVFAGARICGDGDVENYAKARPSWDVLAAADTTVTATAGFIVRTTSGAFSWYPSALGQIPIKNAVVKKLKSVKLGTDEYIMASSLSTLREIQGIVGYKMPAASGVFASDVFFAGLICKNTSVTPTNPNLPPKSAIPDLFAKSVKSSVASAVAAAVSGGNLTGIEHFSINSSKSNIDVSFGGGPGNASTDPLVGAARAVLALPYPCPNPLDCTTLADYTHPIGSSSAVAKVAQIVIELNSKPTCDSVSVINSGTVFWWEPFPLQLTCELMLAGNALQSSLHALASPAGIPTQSEFESHRDGLAKILATAGVLQQVQAAFSLATSGSQNADSCFPATGPYVDKIMNSLTVGKMLTTSKNISLKSMHPESGYAVGQYTSYFSNPQTTGNDYMLFRTGGDDKSLLQLIQGTGPTLDGAARMAPASILLDFRFRALGCCGTEACFC